MWLMLSAMALAGEAVDGAWTLHILESDNPQEMIDKIRAQTAEASKTQATPQSGPTGGSGPSEGIQDEGASPSTDDNPKRRTLTQRATDGLLRDGTRLDVDIDGGLVTIAWANTGPMDLVFGAPATVVKNEDLGRKEKFRAWHMHDAIILQRSVAGIRLTETLLPPEDGELVVVVEVKSAEFPMPLEFRRVYLPTKAPVATE